MVESTKRPAPKSAAGALALLILFCGTLPVAASDIRLQIANDPTTGNPRPDDLYTSDLAIDLEFERFRITAGESMFTDRERNFRFDETHLSIAREVRPAGAWSGTVSLGALRAGRGVLGERMQNRVHCWIGNEEVRLRYAGKNEHFAAAEVSLRRSFDDGGPTAVRIEVDGSAAPRFRSWTRAMAVAERPSIAGSTIAVGAGVRADTASPRWFGGRIGGVSPALFAAIAYRGLELRWSSNDYGTRTPHVTVSLHAPLTSRKRVS